MMWTVETHKSVNSTQDLIQALAADNRPEGMVVQALRQNKGRGRHGREWVSGDGNLYISVLLRPECEARDIGQLSILAGLCVAKTIRPYLHDPEKLTLKWPNDVLLDGCKCAGILLETELEEGGCIKWAALGIGVNLKSAPKCLGKAVDDYTDSIADLTSFRDELLNNLEHYYMLLASDGFSRIKKEWLDIAHKKGASVKVKIGSKIDGGNFYDIDDQGNLLLQGSNLQIKKITAGEVYL